MGKRRYTDEDYAEWLRLYKIRKLSLDQIAVTAGCPRSTVYRALIKKGVAMRNRRGPSARVKKASVLKFMRANPHLTLRETAARLGIGYSTLRGLLAKEGLTDVRS